VAAASNEGQSALQFARADIAELYPTGMALRSVGLQANYARLKKFRLRVRIQIVHDLDAIQSNFDATAFGENVESWWDFTEFVNAIQRLAISRVVPPRTDYRNNCGANSFRYSRQLAHVWPPSVSLKPTLN
jgi:hypothetical protein